MSSRPGFTQPHFWQRTTLIFVRFIKISVLKKPKTFPKGGAGFTLIELLVYMGMSAIVLVVVSVFMVNLSASAARERIAHDLSTSGQLILNRLTYGIRTATAAPTVAGTTLTIPTSTGVLTYALSGTNVTETLPSGSAEDLNPASVQIESYTLTDEAIGITVAFNVAPTTVTTPPVPSKNFTTTLVPRFTQYD